MRDNTRRMPSPNRTIDRSSQQNEVMVPTFFVELPTEGKFYSADHPLHNKKTIEIKEMTAREEDILSSASLLKEGLAIDRFLESVVYNMDIDPKSITVADRSAILHQSRENAYGCDLYLENYECPECNKIQSITTPLRFEKKDLGSIDGEQKVHINDNGKIEFEFANQSIVECRALDTYLENELLEYASSDQSGGFIGFMLKLMIHSYDGVTEREKLEEMIYNIPAKESRRIRNLYQKAIPQYHTVANVECKGCDYAALEEVPLNADFFFAVK